MKNFVTGSLLLLLGLVLASCSNNNYEQSDSAGESSNETSNHLKILYWQAPSTLNPYLSSGTKDIEAASLILQPLAHYDHLDANMVPTLVEEIPTRDNGGVAEDLMSITWKLKRDIVWSDNTPFTAHDVVFTWQYCAHEEEFGCTSKVSFDDVAQVVAVDDYTVRVEFTQPSHFPYGPFVGALTPILQKEQFQNCLGMNALACTEENFSPHGTGPFIVEDFRANDVISYVANPHYREPGKPFFQTVTLKGGGEAASAARAVLETGEFDYAWNLQVEPEVLEGMAAAGRGQLLTGFGSNVERIMVNQTNEDPSLDAKTRSVYLDGQNPHPFLSDFNVRRALSLAIDRSVLVETGYGFAGEPVCNVIPAPSRFASVANDDCKIQDIAEANRLLDEAGWIRGADGVRAKDGVKLSILYQTSTNSVRQGNQSLVKQWWAEIGVETELRNIDGAVFFGGDPSSPDTIQKFYSDVQMYTNNFEGGDPSKYVEGWDCDQVPGPHNQWGGTNISRGCSDEYDEKLAILKDTSDMNERERIIKELNDMVVQNYWEIPLIHRARVSAKSNSLQGVKMNPWDSELWNIADWYRE